MASLKTQEEQRAQIEELAFVNSEQAILITGLKARLEATEQEKERAVRTCQDKSQLVASLKAETSALKQAVEKQALEIASLNEIISLQKTTQKHLFKELECSFINHDRTVRHSELSADIKVNTI